MTGKAIRRYQMLVRVSRFGAQHSDAFPPHTVGGQTFVAVGDAVHAIERHAAAHTSSRTSDGPRHKAIARNRLRESLRTISRTARAFAADTPGIMSRFHVPKTNGDRALLTTARGFAHHARSLAAIFLAHELPPTFLDDLEADTNALERATGDYRAIKQAGAMAQTAVDAELARGLRCVRRLDAIVANVCGNDFTAMAAWRQARRTARALRRHGRKTSNSAIDHHELAAPIARTRSAARLSE